MRAVGRDDHGAQVDLSVVHVQRVLAVRNIGKRADGLDLSGTLYLPPGYDQKRDGALPVLMWAYPEEFKSAKAAAQVTGSPYRFTRPAALSALPFLVRGYAVLDNPSIPIVGEGTKEPNDTYVDQLVAGAKAAVDELVRRGVGDRDRMAVGGHSYGAFMTANLLAHSDLFRAGIARSGAYNRTLTPFSFQAEERTFWEVPDTYMTMSPFRYADKINEPILLIHGIDDDNSGTFPIQSERLFQAIKGLGGTARLVMLPYEAHGYRARESVMHMLWESDRWLEGTRRMIAVGDDAGLPEPIHHVHHTALVADPVATVAALYTHFDLEFTPAAADAMRRYARQRPRGGYGPRDYRFEDHGLDAATERGKFRGYTARFGIVEEGFTA